MLCHQETSQRILCTYLDSHALSPVYPWFLHSARRLFLHYSTGGANRLPPLLKFNEKTGESSRRRRQRIEELLRNHAKPYSLDDFIAFSEDRNDGPDNSIRRTSSTPKKAVTLSVWIVYFPKNGHPQLYVRLANPKEEEKTSRLNLDDVFYDHKRGAWLSDFERTLLPPPL